MSLHKYLYAHANPVMNSDPTGYFTLFEMSVAINVQNTLRDTYNSAIIDGFLNFLDTLLGGETDPTALLTSFARGVSSGLVTGALSSGISAMANLSCKLAKASSMLKMGMAGFGFLGSAYSTLQSVEDGNAQQAGFRFILTAVSGIGFKRAMGEGMATINSNCFIAGTLVLTENGNKPIEEIQAGDKVLAENPETGEQEYKEVVQVFENETNELVHLTVNGEEIVTTPKHPFYVPQRGWISAIDLKAGDILVLSNGEYVTVEQVQHEILETPVKVYNFEVQDFHTYYVGSNSVLVHNVCGTEVLDNANYAQKTYNNKFSAEGRRIYSDLVGEPINTVSDLVSAINSGKVNVADLPVEYIVRDGNTLILNTRTSQALTQAGIPRNQWNAIDRTGVPLFEELLTGQLSRNKLNSQGISIVRLSGGQ